jgi:pyruvate,water dikinase
MGQPEDIWFLSISDLKALKEGALGDHEAAAILERNKNYYQAFRNYTIPGLIGKRRVRDRLHADGSGQPDHEGNPPENGGVIAENSLRITGIGASTGVITGIARVISGFDQTDLLQPDDILVTRYTDTGWTVKFSGLSGVVTEYGGILCHGAVVSREYGLPCVACATDATKRIPNGARIRVDGSAGTIEILDAKKESS